MKIKRLYIYCIWFPTSKKRYIGQTCNLERRIPRHLRSDNLVGRALQKYDDWQVSVLHTCKSRDIANLLEIEEIRNFNSLNPNGYNMTAGGDGSNGFKHTEESIEKISIGMVGKNKGCKGYKCSDLSREIARKGITKRNEEKNPMKDPKVAKKQGIAQQGIQVGKKNGNYKSGRYTKEAKMKRLQEKIKELENK